MIHVSLHRAMLIPTGAVYVRLRSVYSQIIRLQLVHVSVKIDHRLRMGTVHVSEGPEIAQKKALIPFPQEVTVSSGPC